MNTHVQHYVSVLALLLVVSGSSLAAQQTTERYIPIGYSPGLSAEYNWIGEITSIDRQARTVTIRNAQGDRTVRITDSTHIWVDRTAMARTNTAGGMSDLIVGRRAEIKYTEYVRKDVAAWIKVAGS